MDTAKRVRLLWDDSYRTAAVGTMVVTRLGYYAGWMQHVDGLGTRNRGFRGGAAYGRSVVVVVVVNACAKNGLFELHRRAMSN